TPATAENEPICPIPHKGHALETAGGNPSVFTSTRFSTLTMRVQMFVTCGHEPRGARRGTHRVLTGCRRPAGSAASRTGSADSRGARVPAPSTRGPVRRHHLGSSAHCERPCCLSVPTPDARRRELGLRPKALVAYVAACRRASCRRNFRQEARLGQLKSAEQLPARRFPRATGCRWNRRPPTADQKTVLTAIILRFLQQSVSEE